MKPNVVAVYVLALLSLVAVCKLVSSPRAHRVQLLQPRYTLVPGFDEEGERSCE
jgi:hypothetical protein